MTTVFALPDADLTPHLAQLNGSRGSSPDRRCDLKLNLAVTEVGG